MKKYIVSELWGNLMSENIEIEAPDMKTAKQKYLEKEGITETHRLVYDSIKNHVQDSKFCIALQEGYYDKEQNTTFIRGKRYFYKIIKK